MPTILPLICLLQVGLNNYSAAYATGLLCARRVLTKFGLADTYKGQEEPDGELKDITTGVMVTAAAAAAAVVFSNSRRGRQQQQQCCVSSTNSNGYVRAATVVSMTATATSAGIS